MVKIAKAIFVLGLLILNVSCQSEIENPSEFVSDVGDFELLLGEWHFVSNQKGSPINAPPTFDILEFLPQQKMLLRSTLGKYSFEGALAVSGDTVSYTFHPPDVDEPIEHRVKMALSDSGDTLTMVLPMFDGERGVVYMRPDQLLSAEVSGEWFVEKSGERKTMSLGQDGSFSLQNEVFGFYRAFDSHRGPAIMAAIPYGEHDTHIVFWLFERQGEKLTLIPVQGKPIREQTVIWTLSNGNGR